jgi:hypothetical protein
MLFDAPINDGANLFIWIVCVLIGFAAALGFVDNLKVSRKEKESNKEQE